jgi:3,4-dihydroxy-2-butanone 4-phosphate synthase
MSLESGIQSLKRGEFVLLFDSAGRENEVDMVAAGEFVMWPECVNTLEAYFVFR